MNEQVHLITPCVRSADIWRFINTDYSGESHSLPYVNKTNLEFSRQFVP